MKRSLPSVVCLSLLLFHTHLSLAKRGGGGFGKGWGGKKSSTSNRGSTNTNTNTNSNTGKGSTSQGGGGHPRQPNQGGRYPSYPQYPARGSPYGGGYMNHNPNNKVLSPRYGGSYGYGGHGGRGGSPFSHSVQSMGMYPSDRSRGFGRTAMIAAGGGAMVGMAVGYGLGRFPRPPYHFHNSQEEHYYNHYMHRRYGTQSTDANDYSRDYKYSKPPESYDSFMDSCMKRKDLLPNNKPATAFVTSARDSQETNGTTDNSSSTPAPSTPRPLNRPAALSSQDDDDTVSIVEIGYPALIEQMKARRCLELYMVYSEKYLKKVQGGVQRLEMQGLLAVVSSTILMLLNSNMLTLLH